MFSVTVVDTSLLAEAPAYEFAISGRGSFFLSRSRCARLWLTGRCRRSR
jgi:hypothetical protein